MNYEQMLYDLICEVAAPLETLRIQIDKKPYKELSPNLQNLIIKACDKLRSTVMELNDKRN